MPCWDTFNSQLFVDRPKILEEILAWAEVKEVEKRILYILAPPGAGKTWILQTLYDRWSRDRLVLWVDIPSLVLVSSSGTAVLWNLPACERWVEDTQRKAQEYCPDLPSIGFIPQFANIVSTLTKLICDCNLEKAPIIIVDGYDEIKAHQAEEVGYQLLDRLADRPCTRILIAHRDEWGISGQVITHNYRAIRLDEFDPLPQDFAQQQFKLIKNKCYPKASHLPIDEWMTDQFKHYGWNHPFINGYLFDRVLSDTITALRPISIQDIEACCTEVIQRRNPDGTSRHAPLDIGEWECLLKLAILLSPEWVAADLEKIGISNILDSNFKKLFENGLVFSRNPFYRVASGLRELLRDLEDKREKEKREEEAQL